jgi:ApbE superfamily uncharacterized protein (UPF0280 family)
MLPVDLVSFQVRHRETDLWCAVDREGFTLQTAPSALAAVVSLRRDLEDYIARHQEFHSSLVPVAVAPGAPGVVVDMARAAREAGVGPMAAVAGAVAEAVGRHLAQSCSEVVVENGGDVFLLSRKSRVIALYAGVSPLSGRVGLEVRAPGGLGVCSSSGTVGHSLSFGRADCVMVMSHWTALADAYATALGNRVKGQEDIDAALDLASRCGGIQGVVLVAGGRVGAWGDVVLRPVSPGLGDVVAGGPQGHRDE